MATKDNRGKVWSDEATRALITLWSEEAIQISLDTCKTSRQTSKVYQIILRQLENKGFEGFTLKEIISKMKKLRQKYKTEKDKTRKSGNGAGKKWKFFDDIDAFLMRKHNVTPPCLVDTMAETKDNEKQCPEQSENSIVDDLIDKYGDGETFIRKCTTCDFEQKIRSAGVHVSNGGSIQVFTDEDEFYCPNCHTSEGFQEITNLDKPKKDGSDLETLEEADKTGVASGIDKTGKSKENDVSTKDKLPGKKKRKSSIEKSLDIVFEKMKQTADTDFERYQKLEEQKITKEHEFKMKQLEMEKEMRKEEREHELNMLRLLVAQQPASASPQPSLTSSNPFNMPVSDFLPSSPQIPGTAQIFNDSGNTNYSIYTTSETPSYFKL